MSWFRHCEGMVDDQKWEEIAEQIKVAPCQVSTIFAKLCEYAADNHLRGFARGTITGFKPCLIRRFVRLAEEQVVAVIELMRQIEVLVGDKIAAWTRRGNAAELCQTATETVSRGSDAVAATGRRVIAVKPPSTPRVRALRDRKKQLSLMLTITGGGAAAPANRSASVNDETPALPVSCGVSSAENANENIALRESPREEEKREDSFFQKGKGSGARDARLSVVADEGGSWKRAGAEPPPDGAWLRERKRGLLEQKLWRFMVATMAGPEYEQAASGLMASDRTVAQRWFDRLDRAMRAAGWDDSRMAAAG